MGGNEAAVSENERRATAKEDRYQMALKAVIASGVAYYPDQVRKFLEGPMINTQFLKMRVQYAAQELVKGRDVADTQHEDVSTLPFYRVTGPYAIRVAREKMKKQDEWINQQGQTEAEIGWSNNERRMSLAKSQTKVFKQAIEERRSLDALNILMELFDHLLLNWGIKDPQLVEFFDQVADIIVENSKTSPQFLQRLLKVESPRNSNHLIYQNAKTVLYELWDNVSAAKKQSLKTVFAPWVTTESLQLLGNPLHAATFDNDPGAFITLIDLGAKIDTPNGDKKFDNEPNNSEYIGRTAFENGFHTVITYERGDRRFSIKAFAHYMDWMLQRIENSGAMIVGSTNPEPEIVKRHIPADGIVPHEHGDGNYKMTYFDEKDGSTSGILQTNGWLSPTVVTYKREFYGPYQSLRTEMLTAIKPTFINKTSAMNILNKGEYKVFMYLKWLGHIRVMGDSPKGTIDQFYTKPCFATGNTYLHYLVSHWDDPNYVSSNYERQMRLSAIEHVLHICGDKARFAKNKEGKTPLDLCDSENLRAILRYQGINLEGTWSERVAAAFTSEPEALKTLPTQLTSDSMQLMERTLADIEAYELKYNENILPLEKNLSEDIKKFIDAYIFDLMINREKREASDFVVMLYEKITLNTPQLRAALTYKDKFYNLFGSHLLTLLERLFKNVIDLKTIETLGEQGLRDQLSCLEASKEREKGGKTHNAQRRADLGAPTVMGESENRTSMQNGIDTLSAMHENFMKPKSFILPTIYNMPSPSAPPIDNAFLSAASSSSSSNSNNNSNVLMNHTILTAASTLGAIASASGSQSFGNTGINNGVINEHTTIQRNEV